MFEWKHFLELARFLQQEAGKIDNPEPFLRAALSRAYYGAFCFARNYARDWLGFQPRNEGEDHGLLREHLKRKKRWKVSEKLERLRDWRHDRDYEDELTFDPQVSLASALRAAEYV